jgi:hypothetical protein
VSPGAIVISWLTEFRLPPIGSAMKRSVASPPDTLRGIVSVVLLFPVAIPRRKRCEFRTAYTVMSENPWLSTSTTVGSFGFGLPEPPPIPAHAAAAKSKSETDIDWIFMAGSAAGSGSSRIAERHNAFQRWAA